VNRVLVHLARGVLPLLWVVLAVVDATKWVRERFELRRDRRTARRFSALQEAVPVPDSPSASRAVTGATQPPAAHAFGDHYSCGGLDGLNPSEVQHLETCVIPKVIAGLAVRPAAGEGWPNVPSAHDPLTTRLARLGAQMREDENKVLIADAVEALFSLTNPDLMNGGHCACCASRPTA